MLVKRCLDEIDDLAVRRRQLGDEEGGSGQQEQLAVDRHEKLSA